MASLDVLDYQTGLDAALAQRGSDGRPLLEPALRKQAMRDVRRTIDAMAFRFALIDDRPLPEDLDYIRALEAIKPPERAAPVLARRRPIYRQVRRRRLVTSWTILGMFLLFIGGIVYAANYEGSVELAAVNERRASGDFEESTFVVDGNITRLYLEGTIVVGRDEPGTISVYLDGPDGIQRFSEHFTSSSGNYLRENLHNPPPGEWTLRVVYDAAGSARVTVNGVSPNR